MPQSKHDRVPVTDEGVVVLGDAHLAQLADEQRNPLTGRLTRAPRLRRVGRRLWSSGVWCKEAVARPWQYLWNPRHLLGRWWGRVRLWSPTATFNVWKLGLLLMAGLTGVLLFLGEPLGLPFGLPYASKAHPAEETVNAVLSSLFGLAVVALIASLWNDLFRCPWLGHRIRKRIRKDPSSVLHAHLGTRRHKLVPVQDPLEFAPRIELFDEVLDGVLARDSKGVQMVVGEPGSGKTTAMIQLAAVLARIGVLPVLVPLRARQQVEDLVALARDQLKDQIEPFVRSEGEAELLWRWLCRRRRVAILVDDVDQIGPDGERGYLLRRTLEEAASRELPIVVTARPSGVPAGLAASSIELGQLDDAQAVTCVEKGARSDPAFNSATAVSRRILEDWIREGELAAVPFYLELLAHLVAGGRCPRLPAPDPYALSDEADGRYRHTAGGGYRWNPLWVRFLLLEHFYEGAASGRVRRWLGVEASERRSSLIALEGAALGTLAATGIRARVALDYGDRSKVEREDAEPKRERIEDFIETKDRERDEEFALHAERRASFASAAAAEQERAEALPDDHRRARVSAHEVVDAGERLRILDCGPGGELQFRHRIMQAYLAGCRLALIQYHRTALGGAPQTILDSEHDDWIGALLDATHPEKLTAHMALVFAALSAHVEGEAAASRRRYAEEHGTSERDAGDADTGDADTGDADADVWQKVARDIARRLYGGAAKSLRLHEDHGAIEAVVALARDSMGRPAMSISLIAQPDPPTGAHADHLSAAIDPHEAPNPEDRLDPDDALTKLATAAEIACAIGCNIEEDDDHATLVGMVSKARFATRWTKLEAIKAIAQLRSRASWRCIWKFARDQDYLVRQAASDELGAQAFDAFKELHDDIHTVILRAAARSALGLSLTQVERHAELSHGRDDGAPKRQSLQRDYQIDRWTYDDVLEMRALAWMLPAIVSGLREDPATHALEAWHGRDGSRLTGERPSRSRRARLGRDEQDYTLFPDYVNDAHTALAQLVALGFQGGQRGLEEALALGFKGDAMRHAHGGDTLIAPKSSRERDGAAGAQSVAGPGWVASNRRFVIEICLERTESWYARLLLAQALALYTIAGASRTDALDAIARLVHRGRERHPFTQRGARLARGAIYRRRMHNQRWHLFVWDDEGPVAGRRQASLSLRTAQLLADVTVLLDLKEGSPDDRHEPFGAMRQLPHCLSSSRNRAEILGKGCPDGCGWGFCPYKQPPPDEPNTHRGVTRAFCREQRRIARWRRPRWQRRISRRRLRAFWREMEQRART